MRLLGKFLNVKLEGGASLGGLRGGGGGGGGEGGFTIGGFSEFLTGRTWSGKVTSFVVYSPSVEIPLSKALTLMGGGAQKGKTRFHLEAFK